MQQTVNRPVLVRFAFAFAMIVFVLCIRQLTDPLHEERERWVITSMLAGILLGAWYGGFGTALTVGIGSWVALVILYHDPAEESDPTGLIIYFAIVVCMSLLGGGMWSARRRAEVAAERLSTTLASIGDAVIVTDVDGRITSMNPVAELLTGWKMGDAADKPLDEVFVIRNEQTQQAIESPAKRALREGSIVGLANHTILIGRGGGKVAIDDSAAPIRGADGRMIGVVLVFRDVTERRRAEETRRRLAAIVESSMDAIVGKTLDGKITVWNDAAERLYGYGADEMIGRPFSVLVPSDHASEVDVSLERIRAGKHVHAFETVRRRKDGTLVEVSLSYSPILGLDERPIGAAVIARDVTEQKNAERRRNARASVAHILAEARSLEEAARPIVQTLCEQLGWTVGTIWLVDQKADCLRCFDAWTDPRSGCEELLAATRVLALAKGDGLPGTVWGSGDVLWSANVADDERCLRRQIASKEHLRSALVCPIAQEDEFFGVIELFGRDILQPDGGFLEMMAMIGDSIALFLERRAAEEKLRRSETELADFFENATVGVEWIGPDGTILRVNKAGLAIVGYSRDEYLGKNVAELHRDRYAIANLLARVAAGEVLRDVPARIIRKDGAICDVLIDASGRFERSQLLFARCFVRDVTDKRRFEQALRGNEERLRLALDAGSMGVWDWDVETNEIKWSENLEPIHGLKTGSFDGTFDGFKRLIHPADREAVLNAVQNTLDGDSRYDIEFRIIWPDRSVHWISARGELHVDESGARRMIGVAIDITPRKLAEDTSRFLADASAELASLIDYESTLQKVARLSVPFFADWCAVAMLDADGSLRRVAVAHVDPQKTSLAQEIAAGLLPDNESNDGAWHVIRSGKSDLIEEMTPQRLAEMVAEPQLGAVDRLGLRSYLGVPIKTREQIMGAMYFVSSESARRYGPRDLAVAEDLATRAAVAIENARLYQQVREADRRKDEFLAMLAHELRNPLAPIRSGLDFLSLSHPEPNETVRLMQEQVGHLVRLVDDLLDVSRIVRGKVELRREALDLAALACRAADYVRTLTDSRQQTLIVNVPQAAVWVDADRVRLTQIIENLLNNASKYTDNGGRIELAVERDRGEAALVVKDNGIGIEPQLLPQVFDLFMQSSRALDRAQGGLGIGLTLVRNLVEMHGGSVSVASEGPGKGSTFTVHLPIVQPPLEHKPEAESSSSDLSRRILVVDDNIDAARTLSLVIGHLGPHKVDVVHDGPSAVEQIAKTRPDIVLLDIGLPGMNGYEVGRSVRNDSALDHVLLVAVTGYGQEEDRRVSRQAGFDEHLVKPVGVDALIKLFVHPKLNDARPARDLPAQN